MSREEVRALVKEMMCKILAELSTTRHVSALSGRIEMVETDGLLTEADVIRMIGKGVQTINLKKGCIVTPLAADKAREHSITICKRDM